MNRSEGKKIIETKVKDFSQNEKQYLNSSFGETENRDRFIDPFFKALGWDFDQTNISRHLWDVHREYAQRQNAKTRRPDYVFRHKGRKKFFVEAKAPCVPLTDKGPVFQAKSYAFSTNGKTPIVVLTDFEEFRVFNALQRPIFDNPLQGLIKEFDLKYTQYIESWDLLYDTFSKEAVFENGLDRLKGKVQKNTKTLDKEFLADLTEWREILAKRIAIDNPSISVDAVNECVQRILDRLIFLRNLEDREVETDARLQLESLAQSQEEIYPRLKAFFREMDKKYNGLIFKEHLSEKINVDDKTIKSIIKNLCPPVSPYQFDVIEPEILGRIYEKFLGSKIRLTDSHRAKVEEKPEVRHAGGVYYTPEWVVHYIVENTLGKLIKGKSPKDIRAIKVLDPACGSGSFLLGAFSYLLRYHEQWYRTHASSSKEYKNDFYYDDEEQVRVRLSKKASILKENIYGIDIDSEAVEVAIMSLYLKLLEQGYDRGQGELMARGFLLPDLIENIRQGNSLIDRDMLLQRDMFGDEGFLPFDWKDEKNGFGQIFKEAGGFDCILGNPPYIRIQEIQKWKPKTVQVYKENYKSGEKGNYDIYVLFIERVLQALNKNGIVGYITPNKYLQQEYGISLRKIIASGQHLKQIINFKHGQVFLGATTYTCITILTKGASKSFQYTDVGIDPENLSFTEIDSKKLSEKPWNFYSVGDMKIMSKVEQFPKLEVICDRIFVGVQTSADKVFILDLIEEKRNTFVLFSKSLNQEVELGKKYLRHIISGTDVKSYRLPSKRQFVIYPYEVIDDTASLLRKDTMQKNNPRLWEYLFHNKKTLENREQGRFRGHQWYQFGRSQNIDKQHTIKLCIPRLVKKIQCIFDENGSYCLDNVDVGGIILKGEYKDLYYYVLGLLNSDLSSFVLSKISTPFRGGFYSCNRQYLSQLPIYIPDPKDKAKYELCQKIEQYARDIIAFKKNGKDTDAEFLEKKVDAMVAELYGI